MTRRRLRAGARAVLSVTLACAVPAPAAAQHAFPYRLHPVRDAVLLTGGAAALAGSVAVSSTVHPLTPEAIDALDPAGINGFDRPATERWSAAASDLSDAALVATVAAPFTLLGLARGETAPITVAVMFGETVLLGNGVAQLIKMSAERIRPFVYNDDPEIPLESKTSKNALNSFPSGHATNAFAAAVFLSTVFGKIRPASPARPWIWAGSLTLAGGVSSLRYAAGKHFPTDILAGAVLGAGIGWAIPKIHETDRVGISVAPTSDGTVLAFSLRY